jgi:hypothetical protein
MLHDPGASRCDDGGMRLRSFPGLANLSGSGFTFCLKVLLLKDRIALSRTRRRGAYQMQKEGLSKKISFLRPGWWAVHLVGITVVYVLGHVLWR